jgi:hypothetical protein
MVSQPLDRLGSLWREWGAARPDPLGQWLRCTCGEWRENHGHQCGREHKRVGVGAQRLLCQADPRQHKGELADLKQAQPDCEWRDITVAEGARNATDSTARFA